MADSKESTGYLMVKPDGVHQIWLLSLHGRLYSAPLPSRIGSILDIGCGTGAWALAVAKDRPDSKIIATDLTPPKLTPPPQLKFIAADADEQWDFNAPFSFIHGRMLASGIHDWPSLLSKCWDHLEPGGWLEFLDICHPFRAQDPASDNLSSGFIKWGHVAESCWAMKGLDYRATTKHQERLRALVFTNVREENLQWPLGAWSDSAEKRLIGRLALDNFNTFLATAGVSIIGHHPDLTAQEAKALVANAKKSLNDDYQVKRFYLTIKIHTAQKPY